MNKFQHLKGNKRKVKNSFPFILQKIKQLNKERK